MEDLTFAHIAWDSWNATRGGMRAIKSRQQRRLRELVRFVRAKSRYYAEKYRSLPEGVDDVQQLAPVLKPDLLKYFDDWVTDPEVTKASVQAFIADKSLVGHHYLGRYFVCTTSGTTGVPTMLVHDAGMLSLSSAVELAAGSRHGDSHLAIGSALGACRAASPRFLLPAAISKAWPV